MSNSTRHRVLSMLAYGPSWTYAMMAGSDITGPTLRRTLKILQEQGLVETSLVVSPVGPARRMWALTQAGQDALAGGSRG